MSEVTKGSQMTDDQLPDDPSQWPSSPWKLFGLDSDADLASLRRAYSRLIRQFRPDTHPVEFQRIREAYEQINSSITAQVQFELQADIEPSSHESELSPNSPIEPAISKRNAVDREVALNVYETFAQHEKTSVAEAYHTLIRHYEQNSSETTMAALYWQLVINPDLDSQREPADWLLKGLSFASGSTTLVKLFGQELGLNSKFALKSDTGHILLRIPVRSRSNLLFQRWKQAAAAENWQVISDDLAAHRESFVDSDVTAWVRLTIIAAGHAAWSRHPDAVGILDFCRQEIAIFGDVHLELNAELMQFDLLEILSRTFDVLVTSQRRITQTFAQALPAVWNSSTNVRSVVIPILIDLLSQPEIALVELDKVVRIAPTVLQYFYDVLDQVALAWIDDSDTPAGRVTAERIVHFQILSPMSGYSMSRESILRFCLDEFISPESLAATLEAEQDVALVFDGSKTQTFESIRNDLSLRFLCKAHRAVYG